MANWWDAATAATPLDAALQAEGVSGKQADLARSIYQQESSSGTNTSTSNAGAVGGMQIIPTTFASVADKGWDINNPIDNARAGVRYVGQMLKDAGGDVKLAAAGYYGGPGAIAKARQGIAVSDPRNPNAPTTLQYADQVVSRMPGDQSNWWESAQPVDPSQVKMPPGFTPINQESGPVPNEPHPNPGDGGVLAGIEMGLRDPIDAGAQMLRRAVPDSVGNAVDEFGNYLHGLGLPVAQSNGVQGVDNLVNQANAKYEAARAADGRTGFDWARLGGNVIGTLPVLAATPEALATRLGAMGTGLAQGAALGALQPVVGSRAQSDFGSNKASQVALGAALGTVLPAAGRAISPVASRVGNEAQKLLGEGVQLTPGQALGGALMRMEDRAMSVPILGDAIRSARQRGNESLNRAVYNRVLAPIGQSTNKIGREAVSDARQKISQAYDDALKNVQFTPDNTFAQNIANLRNMAQSLPARERRAFENVLQREVIEPLSKGRAIDGLAFKDIETNLGNQAAKFKGSTDAYQKDLGDAIGEVQRALRENLERMNPQYAQKLHNANTAFANFVRLEKAAGAIGAHDGVFTPQQLARAIQQTDRSVRKGAYSRGDALMQDLSDAAQSRMSAQIPDSGTAGRLMNTAALGSYFVNPAIPAGLAASAVPYLPGISRAVTGAIARRPASAAALARGLNRFPPGVLGVLGNQSQ